MPDWNNTAASATVSTRLFILFFILLYRVYLSFDRLPKITAIGQCKLMFIKFLADVSKLSVYLFIRRRGQADAAVGVHNYDTLRRTSLSSLLVGCYE